MNADFLSFARSNDLNIPCILLSVQFHELPFLLPVIDCTNRDDDDDGNNNGNAFDPFNAGLSRRVRLTNSLVDAKGKRDDCCYSKENEDLVVVRHPG